MITDNYCRIITCSCPFLHFLHIFLQGLNTRQTHICICRWVRSRTMLYSFDICVCSLDWTKGTIETLCEEGWFINVSQVMANRCDRIYTYKTNKCDIQANRTKDLYDILKQRPFLITLTLNVNQNKIITEDYRVTYNFNLQIPKPIQIIPQAIHSRGFL